MFNNSATPLDKNQRNYNNARICLASILVFTLINIILAFAGSGTYFLYSAYGSYEYGYFAAIYLTDPGLLEIEMTAEEATANGVINLVIALILLVPYVLSFFLSKKRGGWLIVGLVFFGLDTLYMLLMVGIDTGWILDYVFHAIVIVELVLGIKANSALKKAAAESLEQTDYQVVNDEPGNTYSGIDSETFKNDDENKF